MLYLLFSLGSERYALAAHQVRTVSAIPFLKRLPNVPLWVAGLASDADGTFPVLDLSALTVSRAAARVMSTRVAVVDYAPAISEGGGAVAAVRLGLIVERATATARIDDALFEPLQLATPESPYLGPVARHAGELVQRITVAALLPAPVRERLFAETR